MSEVWKDIEDYNDYQVSNYGRVKSLKYGKEKILKPFKDYKGYIGVRLWKNGNNKKYLVHRLVAMTFIPNPDNLPCINHIREFEKTNNHVENLEWCNHKYNNTYGTRIERISDKTRNGKLSKKVYQYTMNGEFIKEWPSTMEIQRQLGFAHTHINDCCRGKQKTSYGYIWSYIKEPQSN